MTPDRRGLLLGAARRLFTTQPYDQVTTSAIARDAGVAYGLIAHHFGNKRGLYLAVMNDIAAEISAVHESVPSHGDLPGRLRQALHAHVAYVDSCADSFVALLRGALGADAEHRAAVERLRWIGAQRILMTLEVPGPVPAVLRTAMRGWVGQLDEMIIERIEQGDVSADALVELATAALAATLRAAARIDPAIHYPADVAAALDDILARA